jgi:hypothetical protein
MDEEIIQLLVCITKHLLKMETTAYVNATFALEQAQAWREQDELARDAIKDVGRLCEVLGYDASVQHGVPDRWREELER